LSSDDLTFISYSVLVLVGSHGASAHDFVRMMSDGRIYHAASPSQYYAEPKRLEALGYLSSSREPGRTRDRTVYHLTERGLDALREWMIRPAALPRLSGEPVIRMLAADLVGETPVRESLLAMRNEIAELRVEVAEAAVRAATLPHREKYLLLTHGLARRMFDTYEAWLDDVERELSG
jgi:DNA-binding PadR family transcriptional regulator